MRKARMYQGTAIKRKVPTAVIDGIDLCLYIIILIACLNGMLWLWNY